MRRAKKVTRSVLPEIRLAERHWGESISGSLLEQLKELVKTIGISVAAGDIQLLDGRWYVTHAGLLRLARRKRCVGIETAAISEFCDRINGHYAFKATVFTSRTCKGFVGYGDAEPSNVSSLVRGAEMRVAETRAVNRALRKAYGIGLCSVEEIGTLPSPVEKRPPQSANGNGNGTGPKVRDRLCQIIRQHKLDPELVKAYAVDFCGTKTLRDASREQVENFVQQLADWAEKDRNALLCQLNSYSHTYMQNHWDKLTLFLRQPGAPLDNNLCERALKKAILHRKNALFYRTLNGAQVGDLFMSLIHTCELSRVNPFDYLTELQRYSVALTRNPSEWMPWNYGKTLQRAPTPAPSTALAGAGAPG